VSSAAAALALDDDAPELHSDRLGEIYVVLQTACELACKVCPYWGVRGACHDHDFRAQQGGALPLDTLERFIDEAASFGPRTLTLSGGEPLLYEGWVAAAARAKAAGLSVSLSTNALHIPRYFDEVFRYVDNIHVSLGGTKDIIAQVRSAAFGFDEVMDCLADIAARKRDEGRVRPFVRIIYVVSDLSYHRIVDFYELFERRAIAIDSFYFQQVMYIDQVSLDSQRAWLTEQGMPCQLWPGYLYEPGAVDFDELRAQMAALEGHDNVVFSPALSPDDLAAYYDPERKRGLASHGRCTAPWTQLDLSPNGDLTICPDYVIGNIHEQSLQEIYNGQRARRLRRLLLQQGSFPGCHGCFYHYVSQQEPAPSGRGDPRQGEPA